MRRPFFFLSTLWVVFSCSLPAQAGWRQCVRHVYEAIVPPEFALWRQLPVTPLELRSTQTTYPILVIGAGPAGLAVMDAFERRGISYIGVDAAPGVGGLWRQSGPYSVAYDHLVTNSSKATTHLGMEHEAGTPHYLTHREALEYLERFARNRIPSHKLLFNQRVVRVTHRPDDGSWEVVFAGGNSMRYRAVVVATGHHSPANAFIPQRFKEAAEQAGLAYHHSSAYRNPANYADGTTLIVGFGNSGAEIATAIGEVNPNTFLSIRSPRWLVPDYIGRTPADAFAASGPPLPHWLEMLAFHALQRLTVGHPARLGVGTPDHGLLDRLPVADRGISRAIREGRVTVRSNIKRIETDGSVHFEGSNEPALHPDHILFATGYRRVFPFLTTEYADFENPTFHLSLSVFHPQHRGLSFMPELVVPQGAWPLYVEQANALAAYYHAEAAGAPHVKLFDSLRTLPNPDMKGHLFHHEDKWHVDPKKATGVLRDFSAWVTTGISN